MNASTFRNKLLPSFHYFCWESDNKILSDVYNKDMYLFKDARILGCEPAIIYISNFMGDGVCYKIISMYFIFEGKRVLNLLGELYIVISCKHGHTICYCFKLLLNIKRHDRIIALIHRSAYSYRYKVF